MRDEIKLTAVWSKFGDEDEKRKRSEGKQQSGIYKRSILIE